MTDWFIESEPYYLAIGMTHEQYWEDDPWLTQTYRRAHELTVEMRNQEMWWQGLYNFKALTASLANFSEGLAGKHHQRKEHKYVDEPIRITPLSEKEKRIKAIKDAEKQKAAWEEAERRVVAHKRAKKKTAPNAKQ